MEQPRIAAEGGWPVGQPEQPWIPGPGDTPFFLTLVNPLGDRHLAFDIDGGRFYRLWQYYRPQLISAGDAVILRPSDVDMIVRHVILWVIDHPDHPRIYDIGAEVGGGAKALLLHFAKLAETSHDVWAPQP